MTYLLHHERKEHPSLSLIEFSNADRAFLYLQLIHLLVISLLVIVVFHPELVSEQNQASESVNVAAFDNNLSVGDAYCYQFVRERKWTSGRAR